AQSAWSPLAQSAGSPLRSTGGVPVILRERSESQDPHRQLRSDGSCDSGSFLASAQDDGVPGLASA
ncbi:hypothetical protein, partial [Leucobacter celer]|uniref:hypothetical protein n=1 Tax=Leucobacter celer TaxID=668625 RepID=UPI0019D34617